eukprot:GHVN01002154.1.p1 GENE.GHVN01002154.1~~GHVN01002154.1.p1  ORF type:complete len:820 (-),score=121.16 GHVN01002154.1:2499-4958(-)
MFARLESVDLPKTDNQVKATFETVERDGIGVLLEYFETGQIPPRGNPHRERLFSAEEVHRLIFEVYETHTAHQTNTGEKDSQGNKWLKREVKLQLERFLENRVAPVLIRAEENVILTEVRRYTTQFDRLTTSLSLWFMHCFVNYKLSNKAQVYLDQCLRHKTILPKLLNAFHNMIQLKRAGTPVPDPTAATSLIEIAVSHHPSAMGNGGEGLLEVLYTAACNRACEYWGAKAKRWCEELDLKHYLIEATKGLEEERMLWLDVYDVRIESRKGMWTHMLTDDVAYTLTDNLEPILIQGLTQCLTSLDIPSITADISRLSRIIGHNEKAGQNMAALLQSLFVNIGEEHVNASLNECVKKLEEGKWRGGSSGHRGRPRSALQRIPNEVKCLVETIFRLHRVFYAVVTCFLEGKNADPGYIYNFNQAFERIMNPTQPHAFEGGLVGILSVYFDLLLRENPANEQRAQEVRDNFMTALKTFIHIRDIDVFLNTYSALLAKRLLNETSFSEEDEQLVIAKLKEKCGAHNTSKLERMVQDFLRSKESENSFVQYCQANTEVKDYLEIHEFKVRVISQQCWPLYELTEINLPHEMQTAIKLYEAYYTKTTVNKNRKLNWIHSHGQAQLEGVWTTPSLKKYDFRGNTLQACVLMAFNVTRYGEADMRSGSTSPREWEVAKLCDHVGLDLTLLATILRCFLFSKCNVLVRISGQATRQIERGDVIGVNQHFTSSSRSLKIPIPVEENQSTHKKISEDRSAAMDAAIVRVMKSNRLMDHAKLVTEVAAHLHVFKPSPDAIKERIAGLLDKEFLRRDEKDVSKYHYSAANV